MPKVPKTVRVHEIDTPGAGMQPWEFAWTPSACCVLEDLSGRNLHDYVGDFTDIREARTYEIAFATSASFREENYPNLADFRKVRDLFPAQDDPDWKDFRAKVRDVVSLAFFGKTWAELDAFLAARVEAARQQILAETKLQNFQDNAAACDSTGSGGTSGASESWAGTPNSTGTESTTPT